MLACLLIFSGALAAPPARAELGVDLQRLGRELGQQTRAEPLRFRFMERGEMTPIVLPPWALDAARGECTTVALLGPVPSQFVVHVHPWQGLPRTFASRAGAFQLTRCGKDRISLVQMLVEMRSPRAVVYPLVAVGSAPPAPLEASLPERDAGPEAPPGDPGPPPPPTPFAERLRRFTTSAENAGATGFDATPVPARGRAQLALEPGCHRLLAFAHDGGPRSPLVLAEGDAERSERLLPGENGDVRHELCTVRARRLSLSLDGAEPSDGRDMVVAHFALPSGLPGRFGPEVAERLVTALGQSTAPRKLGTLVATTLGAQGRTPLPRALLPQTCYVAAAVVLHGTAQSISLGVRASAMDAETNGTDSSPELQLGFCTGRSGQVELDVEARGLGLSWLFFLFQMGPARPEAP